MQHNRRKTSKGCDNVKLTLTPVKATDNTVVFSEAIDQEDVLATARLRNVYFPKQTLRDLKWQPGQTLAVDIKPA